MKKRRILGWAIVVGGVLAIVSAFSYAIGQAIIDSSGWHPAFAYPSFLIALVACIAFSAFIKWCFK